MRMNSVPAGSTLSPLFVFVASVLGLLASACGGGSGPSPAACDGDCLSPPAARCEDGVLTRFQGFGECVAGQCVHSVASTVTCEAGCGGPSTCADPVDRCADVACSEPPAATCDGVVRVTYDAAGVCDATTGDCSYAERRQDCAIRDQVCDNGACVAPGPCLGVTCDSPPAARCEGDTAITHDANGTCTEATGLCVYPSDAVDCAERGEICRGGFCQPPEACDGADCSAVPAALCEGDVAVSFRNGRCDSGDNLCTRDTVRTDCAARGEVCADGACVVSTLCQDVTCDALPADRCNGSVATRFVASACNPGTGTCALETETRDCDAEGRACVAGRCQDLECLGVICGNPPAPVCDGDTVIRSGAGTCAGGACIYESLREPCGEGRTCVAGACRDRQACETLDCSEAPASFCDGDDAVALEGPGVCRDGVCLFTEFRQTCADLGRTCRDGACVTPCTGVVCDAPPAPACSGNVALTFTDAGTCNNGTGDCFYAPVSVNCALDGRICEDGACVADPCDTIACDSPPAPVCEGDVLVESLASALCERGICTYAERRRNCAALGQTCLAGACRDACFGVTCDTPPPPLCLADTRAVFEGEGICRLPTGGCSYTPLLENCGDDGGVCRAGVCLGSPCEGVVCTTPPSDACNGTVRTSWAASGVCSDGRCDYARVNEDCAARGEACVDGRCVGACEGVACDTPPAPRCIGDVARVAVGEGTCTEPAGTCAWSFATTNCAAASNVCRDGACVPAPCSGVVCGPPPAGTCDGDIAVIPFGTGTCDAQTGTCGYALRQEDCRLGGGRCLDGACVGPCEGVVCDEPPADLCVGSVRTTWADGACNGLDGTCVWQPVAIDCAATGEVCRDGRCEAPLCTPTTCGPAPAPVCESATVLLVSFGAGTCDPADGSCRYGRRAEDCSLEGGRCEAGRCVPPCEGVTCDEPPAATCAGDLAVTFPAIGVCVEPSGACTYPSTSRNCASEGLRCAAGACVERFCDVTNCDAPPAAFCEGTVAAQPAGPGVCNESAATCEYTVVRRDCALDDERCEAGRCVDRCEGVTCDDPPPSFCAGDVAVVSVAGACTLPGGTCAWQTESTNCLLTGERCRDGRCEAPPCAGVSCITPPAPVCDGATLVISLGPGVCGEEDGLCSFAEVREDCSVEGGSCVAGACRDACFGVACDDPPPAACADDVALIFDTGRCRSGECLYEPETINCAASGLVCRAGACVSDPCLDASFCATPPAGTCSGDVATRFSGPGVCSSSSGTCTFTETVEDCAAQGRTCRAGACIGRCDGVVCDAPPAPSCVGEAAWTWDPVGECVESTGECTYTLNARNCAAESLRCVDGACVEDVCAGVSCLAPPAPFCDGQDAVTSVGPGTCAPASGTCSYTRVRQDCTASAAICRDGVCVSPCTDVVCTQPPDGFCSGTIGVRFQNPGTCIGEGTCNYPPIFENCGSGTRCDAGVCVPLDPCEGVECEPNPAPFCIGNTAIVRTGEGTCSEGSCLYEEAEINCAATGQFCVDGGCVDNDPCGALTCEPPPAGTCMGDVAMVNVFDGTCVAGSCLYVQEPVDCAATGQRCFAGACTDRLPCEGVVCNEPPAPSCRDTNLRVIPAAVGTCSNDACSYATTLESCNAQGLFCLGGACVATNPCSGVNCTTPPPAFCEGNTRQAYVVPGTCTGGDCEYALQATNCAATGQVCVGGACVASTCPGGCATPPPPACETPTIVRRSALPAECDGASGTCLWSNTFEVCDAPGGACVDGACQSAEPCSAANCQSPLPTCEGSVAVTFTPAQCVSGSCSFARLVEDCSRTPGGICITGACISAEPCDGVVCETPPAPVCEGSRRRSWSLPSLCSGGACVYSEAVEDCARTGGSCVDGACVAANACEGVACDGPPEVVCEGNERVVRTPTGVCQDGLCLRTESRTNCAAAGDICRQGVCVGPGASLTGNDVAFNEYMLSPLGGSGTFVEVRNISAGPVQLRGLRIQSSPGGGNWTITTPVSVPAGGVALFAQTGGTLAPEADATYAASALPLSLSTTELTFVSAAGPFGGIRPSLLPRQAGRSTQLDADAAPGATGPWCLSTALYDAQNRGTPGADNFACD